MPLALPARAWVGFKVLLSLSCHAWNMVSLQSSQVSSPFTWKKQILELCVVMLTWPVSDASGLGGRTRYNQVGPCHLPERGHRSKCHSWSTTGMESSTASHLRTLTSFQPDSICSSLSAHLTMTHCEGAKSNESLQPFSLQRNTCVKTRIDPANLQAWQEWQPKTTWHLLHAFWANWKITVWWTSPADKYDPKWHDTNVCFLCTKNLLQCKVNTFMLWTGTELIPLTASWRDLNNFNRNLSFYSACQELGKVSKENDFRIFWCLLKHLLIVLAIYSALVKERVTFFRIIQCCMFCGWTNGWVPRTRW